MVAIRHTTKEFDVSTTRCVAQTRRKGAASVAVIGAAMASWTCVQGAQAASVQNARCAASPPQTEGPYYTDGPPRRQVLATAATKGTHLILTGRVLGTRCQPLTGARVDFWQANATGSYDNSGYKFRGYQLTDAKGRYRLVTVVPGLYPGRTEHIHVKVTPKGRATLTTQLFFPGVAENDGDGIFDARLLIKIKKTKTQWNGTFSFVI